MQHNRKRYPPPSICPLFGPNPKPFCCSKSTDTLSPVKKIRRVRKHKHTPEAVGKLGADFEARKLAPVAEAKDLSVEETIQKTARERYRVALAERCGKCRVTLTPKTRREYIDWGEGLMEFVCAGCHKKGGEPPLWRHKGRKLTQCGSKRSSRYTPLQNL